MNGELTIDCPKSGSEFELTVALAGPLLEAERSRAMAAARKAVETERASIAAKLAARDNIIAERDARLEQARRAELAARKAKDDAERSKQATELTVQRRLDVARSEVAAGAVRKATEVNAAQAWNRREGRAAHTRSAKDQVFTYLTSTPFRQRIARVIETYTEMRWELDKEKRSALTQFSNWERQLERIPGGITGFYSDLQGIAGSSLPPVEGLTLDGLTDAAETARLTIPNSVPALASNDAEPLLS